MAIKTKNVVHSTALVLAMDTAISCMSSLAAILSVRWLLHPFFGFSTLVLLWLVVAFAASLLGLWLAGTHKIVIRYASYRSISKIAWAVLIKELFMIVVLLFSFKEFDGSEGSILIAMDFLISLIALILFRVMVIEVYERMNDDVAVNVGRLNVMVYGVSDKSVAMVSRLEQSTHYMVNGFLTRNKADAGKVLHDTRVYYFENAEDIRKLKMNIGFESVLFARDSDAEEEQNGLVNICLHAGLHMLVSPKVEQMDFGGMSQAAVKEMTDSDFIPDGMTPIMRVLKRVVDLCLSGALLVVFALPMLICYIALKVSDKGPAIYKQERIGRFGRPFYIYKFRSMRTDAEAAGPALYSGDDDPRLTPVGKFLRQHHLDEMPQLFNVFKGDMAFVGYRPERKYFIDKIMEQDPRYYYLYQIRPGVTSYATLKNGYTDSMEKMLRRLEFDLYYLRHRSWYFDIKVLWQTFVNIVFGKKF